MTTNTPQSKTYSGKQIESRVIGVEMYCGFVKEVVLFYTDNLVQGGANIMIEVQRQCEECNFCDVYVSPIFLLFVCWLIVAHCQLLLCWKPN